jgi:hypothetical protein
MGSSRSWSYKMARAVASMEGGISRCVITGVVTPDVAAAILRDNAQWLAETGAIGQVADYVGAAMCIDAMTLHKHAANAAAEYSALSIPTALLVQNDSLEAFDTYAELMAQRGICRGVFASAQKAEQWAAAQAAVWAHLRAQRVAPPAADARRALLCERRQA